MKILIRGTNWIGDTVMTIPAIERLRRLFPDARLSLLTPRSNVGIFRGSDLLDEVIPAGSIARQVSDLRNRRFDLAVIFPNSFKAALVAWLGGVDRRAGYSSQNRTFLLTDAVEAPRGKDERHEVFYYLNLVDAIGRAFGKADETAEPLSQIDIGDAERARAREILERSGIAGKEQIVGLAPGSTNSRAKRWTPEGFAQLNDRLQSELGVKVVLFGSPADKEVSDSVVALSTYKPIDITGETDVADAAALLSEIDVLVSNDMGLAHLAPAVGTQTLVIFGPTNPVTTRPFSDRASIVTAAVECSPCMLRDCPIDHRCMTRVSADDVFSRAKASLSIPKIRNSRLVN
jgi:heptosyltransferase-2